MDWAFRLSCDLGIFDWKGHKNDQNLFPALFSDHSMPISATVSFVQIYRLNYSYELNSVWYVETAKKLDGKQCKDSFNRLVLTKLDFFLNS